MNKKQTRTRAARMSDKRIKLRKALWPDFDFKSLWHRTHNDGYTTMPRTIPQFSIIMDSLAPKAKPVSRIYINLWCRVSDESLLEIKNEAEMATEVGYSGQRAVTLWRSRMKILVDLGFIKVSTGPSGNFQYVLILNPYDVINKLKSEGNEIQQSQYIALLSRAQEVGADSDLD